METQIQTKRTLGSSISLIAFILIASTVLFVFTVPFTWELFWVAFFSYFIRMFAITGVYHRYFSHNAYKTSRVMQFLLAWLGCMAQQKGPLWWAAHHRNHHKYSDTEKDLHSPRLTGFWNSHMLWFLKNDFNDYDPKIIKDYTKYPEIVWLDKYHWIPPLLFSIVLGMISFPVLVYGYAVATFLLGHGTWTINSLSHVIGKPRFDAGDDSKNNWFLAIITMGEGWHNNHHYYRHSANQGFYWYEYDFTYYILKLMSFVGLVWDLKKPPVHVLEEGMKLDAMRKGKKEFKNLSGQWVPVTVRIPTAQTQA
ncbi:MAG TPA: acyl-CoA desaturase [Leptospiraceae bacterium]|nr:acyl-CoA desaturase [Leptospiraceae bacterium]HMW04169.1 acyl-CoA desaturase [Leptospiraceae bacterium]HMX34672.1 acyl-CoA desaturase [Leptospiraceae bacterium]HMY30162.1 acyl-CoA desaturase [Leptospiraceae bacterium]HMZ67213.1 acyl-CoA desaturase [Leptospiraceae bacterium]